MRIIWAIDAFEDQQDLTLKMAQFIARIHEHTEAEVEPVYLLRENEIILPTYEVPTWVMDHSKTAESMFQEILKDLEMPFLLSPKVIPHSAQSHSGSADILSNYATRTNADLIVVGSHAREGMQRFLLGSFAESLLLQAATPVCVITADSSFQTKSQQILFPTEFGEHSKDNFHHTVNLARQLHAEVTLLHVITRPAESVFDVETRNQVYNYKGRMLSLEQILEEQFELQSQRAHQWAQWATEQGVPTKVQIDQSYHPVDEVILHSVRQQEVNLVIMEAQSGPMSAALLGSFTRNVIRKSNCPVYVITRHFYDQKEDRFMERAP